MDVERIRQVLADLDSPDAAPRLNAQVRLRDEHVEMLKLLLLELDETQERLQEEILSRNPYHW